jgi:hypothetical protein
MGTPEPVQPTITVLSGQILIAIGGAAAFALLAVLIMRVLTGRRFSFSLRWLVAFCFACGFIGWGGARWHQSKLQSTAYRTALSTHKGIPNATAPTQRIF